MTRHVTRMTHASGFPSPRRDFLGLAIQGSAVAAAVTLPGISAAQTKGQTSMQTATSEQRYKPRSTSTKSANSGRTYKDAF